MKKLIDSPEIVTSDEQIKPGDRYIHVRDGFIGTCASQDHACKLNFTGNNKKVVS